MLSEMAEKNQKIESEKFELEKKKDFQISELRKQVLFLEQQLIQANLELSNAQNQILQEQSIVMQLEKEKAEQSELIGGLKADRDEIKSKNGPKETVN
jgi:serine phosphatase RsbU (regulator of sigma subunit)